MGWIICSRIDDGAAKHAEGVFFGVVNLQVPEGFGDVIADDFLVGRRLGLFDAVGDHRHRVRVGHKGFL